MIETQGETIKWVKALWHYSLSDRGCDRQAQQKTQEKKLAAGTVSLDIKFLSRSCCYFEHSNKERMHAFSRVDALHAKAVSL